MTACPTCGHDREKDVIRGHLRVEGVHPIVFWHGKALRLSPVQAQLMKVLARHGRASFLHLSMVCPQAEAVRSTVNVHICHLRNRLPAGIALKNIRGWGYELELED